MTLLEWRDYNYFPYELAFARLEVERVIGVAPVEHGDGLLVRNGDVPRDVAERLTYFGRVVHSDGAVTIPRQAQLELGAANGSAARQSTRYSAHGLHEYKGKFNPQVVRAIGNILGLDRDAHVLDPFCGSGTTLLECAHTGWDAFGVDRNPLAVKIANAKLQAFRLAADDQLEKAAEAVTGLLNGPAELLSGSEEIPSPLLEKALGRDWLRDLHGVDYLKAWFPMPVLAQAVAVFRALRSALRAADDRSVFEVILSDQLRDASLQEPADLRIRRRRNPAPNYPLIPSFLEAVRVRIPRIIQARSATPAFSARQVAHLGDIQSINVLGFPESPASGFDAVITSPPYETALPYIDTQRLSLVMLGMIDHKDILRTERQLIGAREISKKERHWLEALIRERRAFLPESVFDLCSTLLKAAEGPSNGFRRKNRPSLTFRYFLGMAAFFRAIRESLREGAPAALVVGTNRTTLSGTEFIIDTPGLLVDVAESQGLRFVESQAMDTYPRYDLHQQNSIDAETLIVLQR